MIQVCEYTHSNDQSTKRVVIYQGRDSDLNTVYCASGVDDSVDPCPMLYLQDYYNLDELKRHCMDWLG